jgi:predicted Zn-dependent protease
MAANRPSDAVTAFSEANKANPSSQLVTRLASSLLRAGKPDEAAKELAAWVSKHPDDVTTMEQLGEIYIAVGKLNDAKWQLEAILKAKPQNAVTLNNLAWVYQQLDDQRAQDLARQAYVLAPGPQTADTLGWILVTGGKSDTALPLLRQAAAEGASDPRILYHYGVALKNAGKREEAVKQLTAVAGWKAEFKEKQEAQKLLDEIGKGS